MKFRTQNSKFQTPEFRPATLLHGMAIPFRVRSRCGGAISTPLPTSTTRCSRPISRSRGRRSGEECFGGREAMDISFFVKSLTIDFKRQVAFYDDVTVWLRVGEIRGASFTFEYRGRGQRRGGRRGCDTAGIALTTRPAVSSGCRRTCERSWRSCRWGDLVWRERYL